jgi:hypothetical protein
MKRFLAILLMGGLIAPLPSLANVSKNPYNRRAKAPVVQKVPVLVKAGEKREAAPPLRRFKGNDPTASWQAYSYP